MFQEQSRKGGLTIVGCIFLASVNSPAINLLLSPYHLFARADNGTLIYSFNRSRNASVPTSLACHSSRLGLTNAAPLSFASALASIVLPHPGGPYKSTPLGAESRPDEELYSWG